MSTNFPFESLYSIQGVLLGPFVSVGLMLFALGFYVLLFGMVIYLLSVREDMVNRRPHLGWMIALFALSVSSAGFDASITITEAALGFQAASTGNADSLMSWETLGVGPQLILSACARTSYLLANCIADAILLYRCYVIWGSTWRALTGVLLLLSFGVNGLDFAANVAIYIAISQHQWDLYEKVNKVVTAYNLAFAANTLLLTLIIAGRIWWMTRDARGILGDNIDRKYKKITSALIESGFLYSATLIVNEGIIQSTSELGFSLNLNPLVDLMVGIAPTLIFLRTSLAINDNAVPEVRMLSTLRFGEPPAAVTSESETYETHSVVLRRASIDGSRDLEAQKVEHSESSSA